MKVPKTDQLRVRLSAVQRKALEQMLRKRDENETLSDLVREIIDLYIDPSPGVVMCPIPKETYDRAIQLALFLDRPIKPLIAQCVVDICDCLQQSEGARPLIVAEYWTRANYRKEMQK